MALSLFDYLSGTECGGWLSVVKILSYLIYICLIQQLEHF